MKRKWLALSLVTAMLFGMTACSTEETEVLEETETSVEDVQETETPETAEETAEQTEVVPEETGYAIGDDWTEVQIFDDTVGAMATFYLPGFDGLEWYIVEDSPVNAVQMDSTINTVCKLGSDEFSTEYQVYVHVGTYQATQVDPMVDVDALNESRSNHFERVEASDNVWVSEEESSRVTDLDYTMYTGSFADGDAVLKVEMHVTAMDEANRGSDDYNTILDAVLNTMTVEANPNARDLSDGVYNGPMNIRFDNTFMFNDQEIEVVRRYSYGSVFVEAYYTDDNGIQYTVSLQNEGVTSTSYRSDDAFSSITLGGRTAYETPYYASAPTGYHVYVATPEHNYNDDCYSSLELYTSINGNADAFTSDVASTLNSFTDAFMSAATVYTFEECVA